MAGLEDGLRVPAGQSGPDRVHAHPSVTPAADALTDPDHWDGYWEKARALPIEVKPGEHSATTAIIEVIDRHVAAPAPLSVVEIGGAPGGYLAHLWRTFGHDVCALDNSEVGVELTRRNFDLLGIPGRVLHRDLFATDEPVPQFDVVYSLGLIEHFADTASVVAAHLAYVKPGGRLIIGCPNLLGLNRILLRRLSPSALDWHHLEVMDIRGWPRFEAALGLQPVFRGYVAGFQPAAFWRRERRTLFDRALARGLAELARRSNGALGRRVASLNSRHWSYYAIGVYDGPRP
jgi:SAM-dependent methyltransferase